MGPTDPLCRVPPGRKFAQARELRRAATSVERFAWSLLRNRGVLGLKFRRQQVVHGFIVDFCCTAERLVLELRARRTRGVNDARTMPRVRQTSRPRAIE